MIEIAVQLRVVPRGVEEREIPDLTRPNEEQVRGSGRITERARFGLRSLFKAKSEVIDKNREITDSFTQRVVSKAEKMRNLLLRIVGRKRSSCTGSHERGGFCLSRSCKVERFGIVKITAGVSRSVSGSKKESQPRISPHMNPQRLSPVELRPVSRSSESQPSADKPKPRAA